MSQDFNPERLLDEAMAERRARAKPKESRPYPPDPELNRLFGEFARRMPDSAAVRIEGFRNADGRGWPIKKTDSRWRPQMYPPKEWTQYYWKGLAVDTDGNLRFTADLRENDESKFGNQEPKSIHLLHDTGWPTIREKEVQISPYLRKIFVDRIPANLREVIIDRMGSYYETPGELLVTTSELPRYLAGLMAEEIQEAGGR